MEPRRTKILATIGPSSEDPEMLRKLFTAGVSACRLNFSHGSHEEHSNRVASIRRISAEMGIAVPIVQDLCGPKVRTDTNTYTIVDGETVRMVPFNGDPEKKRIGVQHGTLYQLAKPGQAIMLDDGKMEMRVTAVEGDEMVCTVINGGLLKPRKSVNTPGMDNGLDVLSEKDRKDALLGRDLKVDWVAVSFVRNGADILRVREYMNEIGWPDARLIAKIETPLAVASLDEIVKLADGIMVARGDLGIECPIETVPTLQKRMVRLTHRHSKMCVVATQMLDSMERSPRPTRAEASDVANAVFEGTQAVMLSGETAGGQFPVEAVTTMNSILLAAEASADTPPTLPEIADQPAEMVAGAVRLAEHTDAAAILVFSHDMDIARQVAAFHTSTKVLAGCFDDTTHRRSSIFYGVTAFKLEPTNSADEGIARLLDTAKSRDLVKVGDRVVCIYSQPFDSKLQNTIRLVQVD